MSRFLLPAFLMVGALVVLFAGALGNLASLPDLTGEWVAHITSNAPESAASPASDDTRTASVPPPAPTASSVVQANRAPVPDTLRQQVAELQVQITQRSKELASIQSSEDQAHHELDALHQQRQTEEAAVAQLQAQRRQMATVQANLPAPDALQQQVAALQAQITQRSQELAALRSNEDQAQRDLATLREQRQTEETTVARLQTQQRQMAAAAPSDTAGRPQPRAQSAPAPADKTAVQTALARLRTTEQTPPRSTHPTSTTPQRAATQPVLVPSPRDDLATAREFLASGRAADARQLLVKAQAQSELRPVTPDQPLATGGNVAATRIGDAIRFLDAGKTGNAVQSINLAMDETTAGTRGWPGYPPQAPPSYGYPAKPPYYDGGGGGH